MTHDIVLPSPGARIRRLRRLRGIKQSDLAQRLDVAQTTVSRWESGTWRPSEADLARALSALQGAPSLDSALRRLIDASSLAMHLIHDSDHRLIAASPVRDRQWRGRTSHHIGRPLWGYATDAIIAAEAALEARGWWDLAAPEPVVVVTGAGGGGDITIVPGRMVWERVWLSDGSPARLCTSLGPA